MSERKQGPATAGAEAMRLYLPADMPAWEPTMDEQGFWKHCQSRRLTFQQCGDCHRFRHPPTPICPRCLSEKIVWKTAPDMAEVYSYTVIHYPSHPAVEPVVPYVVAVVRFPDMDDVRLVTNVVGVRGDEMRIGMPVELAWEGPVHGTYLPRFRPLVAFHD